MFCKKGIIKNISKFTEKHLCQSLVILESCNFIFLYIFFLSGFSFTNTDDSQVSRGREGTFFFFHSTTSTRSRTFRHLFTTLHVRWLSLIFNRNACIYQTATRWDVPPYGITIWLIDVTLSFCLSTWWFDSSFICYSNLRRETGEFELASTITLVLQANRLTKCATHPTLLQVCNFITKEPLAQVLLCEFWDTFTPFFQNTSVSCFWR